MALILLLDVVAVLTLVIAARRRLEDALPLYCFMAVLLPLESRFVVPGLLDLTTNRIALFTLVVLYIVHKKRPTRFPLPLKYFLCIQIVLSAVSAVLSISVSTSVKQVLTQIFEYYALYFVFARSISDTKTIYRAVYAMVLALGVCGVFSTLEAYRSWSILSIFPSDRWLTYDRSDPLYIEWGRGLRVRSTFPHPILFGDGLAMGLPLCLFLLSIWKGRGQRIILWMSLLLMAWSLYKTSSRGPWIAAVFSCGALAFMVRGRVRMHLAIIVVLSALVIVARPGIRQTIVNLYESTFDNSSPIGSSYEYRHALTDAVINAVSQEPSRTLFGYGPGTFREVGLDIYFLDQVHHWYTCDNNWALFLYETGYCGLLIMGLLFSRTLLLLLQSYRRLPSPEKQFSGVASICIVGFCFGLLSVAGYNWGQQGFMAWILISLAIAYPRVALQQRAGTVVSQNVYPAESSAELSLPVVAKT